MIVLQTLVNPSIWTALAGALLTALALIYTSGILKKNGSGFAGSMVFFTYVCAALLLLAIIDMEELRHKLAKDRILFNVTIASILLFISRILYTYAYKHIDAGYVTLFSGITPIYTIGIAWWMLHVIPTINQLLGVILITLSIGIIFWRPVKIDKRHRKAYVAAFLSTIPAAFSVIFQKKALTDISPIHLTFMSFVLIAILSFLYTRLVEKNGLRSLQKEAIAYGKDYIAIGTLTALAHICFFYVMEQNYVVAAQAAQRSSIFFQVLLAYVLLKERSRMTTKLIGSIVGMLSVILLLAH